MCSDTTRGTDRPAAIQQAAGSGRFRRRAEMKGARGGRARASSVRPRWLQGNCRAASQGFCNSTATNCAEPMTRLCGERVAVPVSEDLGAEPAVPHLDDGAELQPLDLGDVFCSPLSLSLGAALYGALQRRFGLPSVAASRSWCGPLSLDDERVTLPPLACSAMHRAGPRRLSD